MNPKLSVLLVFFAFPCFTQAQKHIVPIFGEVRGAETVWRSNLLVNNASDELASVSVTAVIPFTAGSGCVDIATRIEVPARSSRVIDSSEFRCPRQPGPGLVALELDGPAGVTVQPIVFAIGPGESNTQLVEVAAQWIPPDSTGMIFNAFPIIGRQRTNLFLINPNPWPIEVSYGTTAGGQGRARMEPRSGRLVPLDETFGCPAGCGTASLARYHGIDLSLTADGDFLAALSYPSSDRHPIVWVSRPLE